MYKYFVINKPYGMLSQFTKEGGHSSLIDFPKAFPKDVYPVGRLDHDSEGLLILTNDNLLKTRILSPKSGLSKTYLCQVENEIATKEMEILKDGVKINAKGKEYLCKAIYANKVEEPTWLWPRKPPVRERKTIPTDWLEISITEGKNRQVRKMTAAVGLPTLRLIRIKIGSLELEHMKQEQYLELNKSEIYGLLGF